MNETGHQTYCIVIHQTLAVSKCPLGPGECIWRHRQTGDCTYDEDFGSSNFSPSEFATKVGLPPADPSILNIIKNSLAHLIKHELMS